MSFGDDTLEPGAVLVPPPDTTPGPDVATPDNVIAIREVVIEQNNALLHKLQLVGKQPQPLLFLANKLDTLVDFVFAEQDEARGAFETAVQIRLNQQLRDALQQFTATLELPDGA